MKSRSIERQLAEALLHYKQQSLLECYDPVNPESRPTEPQEEILKDFGRIRHQYVVAGNQCLAKGTLVATPRGPVPIEELKIGDLVYDENGKEIKILNTFQNGIKPTYSLINRNEEWVRCTIDHAFQGIKYSRKDHSVIIEERKVSDFDHTFKVRRQWVEAPLGPKHVKEAYMLGAFLGDGCCGEDVLRQWDRDSCLEFLAGLYDSAGSITYNEKAKTITWSIEMQAHSTMLAVEWLLQSLWQIQPSLHVDPLYTLNVKNPHEVKQIMSSLSPLIRSNKTWRDQFDGLGKRSSRDCVYLSVDPKSMQEVETYDIHVDSPTNLYCLSNGIVTHNSGKSTCGLRMVTWMLTETHPHWKRPAAWGDEPLLLLVLNKSNKIINEMIVPRILSYLEPGSFRKVSQGGNVTKIEHSNGNAIIFFSHNELRQARELVQGFVAHFAWIDEMPSGNRAIEFVKEVQMRVHSRSGYFLATFTPLVKSEALRKLVDGAKLPLGKKYRLSLLDNPVNANRKEEILREYEGLPQSQINTRLYGDWSQGEGSVYYYDADTHVQEPEGYSPSWPHVEVVDPASQGKMGYMLLAYSPSVKRWYIIRADYIEHKTPSDIVEEVKRRSSGFNLIRRIADPHESWYLHQAASEGISYVLPSKGKRKEDLIMRSQEHLGPRDDGKGILIAPWCTDFTDELISASWNESGSRIVNATSYHLLDCYQYFVDCIPKVEEVATPKTWQQEWKKHTQDVRRIAYEKQQAAMKKQRDRVTRIQRRRAWN